MYVELLKNKKTPQQMKFQADKYPGEVIFKGNLK